MPVTIPDALGKPFQLPGGERADIPQVGDVWVLSVDGHDTGVVLVGAVRPAHVLAWPITNPSRFAGAPSFPIALPTGEPLIAWPDAEFGLSMAALDRRIAANLVDDRKLRAIRWSLSSSDDLDGHEMCPVIESQGADAAFEAVCACAWAMGNWSWPNNATGVGVFSDEALNSARVRPADLGHLLGVKPVRASALARGEKVPSPEEIAGVVALFPEGTTNGDILRGPRGQEAEVLSRPEFKASVGDIAATKGLTEGEARSLVWEAAYSRAARQSMDGDPLEAAKARVHFAIDGLLED